MAGEREGVPDAWAKRWAVGRTASVDVVVPVYNEERALPGCIQVLRSHLAEQLPFEWTITVVDNASTDATLRVATELAEDDHRVRVLHLGRKGRGRALRTAWEWSDADVVAYMDVDLSTGLDALRAIPMNSFLRWSTATRTSRSVPGWPPARARCAARVAS